MKTTIFPVILGLTLAQSVFAQTNLSAEEIASYQDELMLEELDLTEKQQTSISEINLKYAIKQKSLMDEAGSMFSKMGEMRKIGNHKNSALKEVLTELQFSKYQEDVAPKIRSYMRANIRG